MYKATIVIDDDAKDPLATAAADPSNADLHIEVRRISDFISDHGIKFSNGEVKWEEREEIATTRDPTPLHILDRVVELSNKSIAAIDNERGLIFRGQIYSIYEYLLQKLAAPIISDRAYSTVGKLLPLTSQWTIVSSHITGINFPKFKHGYGPEKIHYDEFQLPIFKSPFDFYSWRPNLRTDDIEIADMFVVDTPKGSPVLSYILGTYVVTSNLGNDAKEIGDELKSRLSKLSQKIATLFGVLVGEVLWFSENDSVTFAAFSPHLFAASHHEKFPRVARNFLKSYFENYHDYYSQQPQYQGMTGSL